MDRSDIVVSFTLDADEARRESAELQKKTGVSKFTLWILSGAAVLWLALGTSEVATNHPRWSGWLYVFGGCLYGCMALQMRSRLIKVPAGVETSARFGVARIVFERPAQLSERMLLGPLRCVSAQLSVDETGTLRRSDAASIANPRARSPSVKRRSDAAC